MSADRETVILTCMPLVCQSREQHGVYSGKHLMEKVLRHFASAFSSSVDMPRNSLHIIMLQRPVVLIFRYVLTDFQEMEMPLLCFPREHVFIKDSHC